LMKEKLVTYNLEDCTALELVTAAVAQIVERGTGLNSEADRSFRNCRRRQCRFQADDLAYL
ncbi:MAG TPA: hypothetical protein VN843_27925, partial [Anaerolineales bacterium]|nr:hypothetical protein [Anaerolineales bacterium]